MFKKVISGDILTNEIAYTLKATSIKRNHIYVNVDNLEIFNHTDPVKYDEIIKND